MKKITAIAILSIALISCNKETKTVTKVDPKTGKTYKCNITRDGDKLNVRGYVGFALIGRTQTWQAVK